ncbi:hypothetical protein Q1695_000200 [Nippostrongylus brasiliensis]|nr:hypothetical protein Q1695_000200 [Nippostrongylus brasiliensis]
MLARQPKAKLPLSMEGPTSFECAPATTTTTSALTTSGAFNLSSTSSLSPEARDDSGVSTMESVFGKEFELNVTPSVNSVQTLADILLSEHNNNYAGSMDVVKLLRLRSVDDEQNQQSNSSSLESLSSLENHQGSQGADGDGGSGSTSCSEDSFEMSSTCSARDTDVSPEEFSPRKEIAQQPPTSLPSSSRRSAVERESRETTCESFTSGGLPELDFAKLEEQLTNAAREREEHDRKLLGEEVRRRLALQADSWKGASPAVSTRPHRSNLALRLQTAMNLQVCYINELAESASESEISESDDEFMVPKSRSAPNLEGTSRPGSSKEDPYLRKLRDRAVREQHLDPSERQKLLHAETKTVLLNAKKSAQTALERYRSTKSRASGVPRQARQYLRNMSMSDVLRIKNTMEQAIYRKNLELVQLLIERDSLHMEHDSLLVDIDDFTEHEAECEALDFPHLLGMMDGRIPPATRDEPNTLSPSSIGLVSPSQNGAPTPAPTPTSPTKAFVAQLPKSLSRFVLFRR